MNSRNEIVRVLLLLTGISLFLYSCDTSMSVDPPYKQYFLKYYGEDGDQEAVDMIVNPDGTFILLGKSTYKQAIMVVKADAAGNIIWQRKFGTSGDSPRDIEPTQDNNFVILSNYKESADNTDIKIIRISNEGNKIDSAQVGTSSNDFGRSITPLSDGGFIISGSTESNPNTILSFLHYRCDANLVFRGGDWRNFYPNELQGSINEVVKVIERDDHFFNVFGYSNTPSLGKEKTLYYYEINEVGDNERISNLNDFEQNIEISYVMKTPDALLPGYLIVGSGISQSSSKLHVSRLKGPLSFTASDKQFSLGVSPIRKLSGIYATSSLTSPLGYLILSNETKATGETDVVLTKIDQSGSDIWSMNFGAEKNDTAAAVAELPDGKIVILCTIESALQSKVALLKLNAKGQLLN